MTRKLVLHEDCKKCNNLKGESDVTFTCLSNKGIMLSLSKLPAPGWSCTSFKEINHFVPREGPWKQWVQQQ